MTVQIVTDDGDVVDLSHVVQIVDEPVPESDLATALNQLAIGINDAARLNRKQCKALFNALTFYAEFYEQHKSNNGTIDSLDTFINALSEQILWAGDYHDTSDYEEVDATYVVIELANSNITIPELYHDDFTKRVVEYLNDQGIVLCSPEDAATLSYHEIISIFQKVFADLQSTPQIDAVLKQRYDRAHAQAANTRETVTWGHLVTQLNATVDAPTEPAVATTDVPDDEQNIF